MKASDVSLQDLSWLEDLPDTMLELIPQSTVKHTIVSQEPEHVSIWDYAVSPQGRHFFSVCAEAHSTNYARLYEYFPDTGYCQKVFSLEDVIVTYDRAIRPSKIHSSIQFLPDGKLLMATHTTAAAPGHPRWMPFAYYDHLQEGYAGSNILICDPDSGRVEDLGIPVPRESFYGGIYDEKTNSYYLSGYARGHVYRFDLSTRRITDFGQATEFGTWRYVKGGDGNLYSSTASGRLFCVNLEQQRLEDIPFDFPCNPRNIAWGTNNKLMHYAHDSRGGFYFTSLSYDHLMHFDCRTRSVEILSPLLPEELAVQDWCVRCMGMDRDESGCLWYLCDVMGLGLYLVRQDVEHGGKPENMGLVGSLTRTVQASYGLFVREGKIFVTDTNRMEEPAAVLQVSISDLLSGKRCLTKDPLFYAKLKNGESRYWVVTGKELSVEASPYLEMMKEDRIRKSSAAFIDTLPQAMDEKGRLKFYGDDAVNSTMIPAKRCGIIKLWKRLGCGEASSVRRIEVENDGTVRAVCGVKNPVEVIAKYGKISVLGPWDGKIQEERDFSEQYAGACLPWKPERRHLAKASAAVDIGSGRQLVGTLDGMLAIVEQGKVYNLGAAADGPIHQLAYSPTADLAAGAAGDPDGLGTIFFYSQKSGLRLCGRIFIHDANVNGLIGASNEPCCLSFSPDGKILAVGVRDRLGCAYWFELADFNS